MRATLLLVVLAGCGRIGFDLDADAGGDAPALDAPGDAPAVCERFGPWGAPALIAELSSPALDGDVWFLPSGRKIYFTRMEDIYTAERASLASPWTNVAPVPELATGSDQEYNPTVTADELQIFYGNSAIESRRRSSTSEPWGPVARALDAGPSFGGALAGALSGGDLDLYFHAYRSSSDRSINVVHRASTAVGFAPEDVVAIGPMGDAGFPTVSADGLEMVYSRMDASNALELYSLERATTDAPWSPANETFLDVLNSPADDTDPALSPDRRELVFNSYRSGGPGGYDLYVSRRDCL